VVDASVALKWFLRGKADELYVTEAEAVLSAIGGSGTELFAPGHWLPEVIAVLTRIKPGAIDDALILLGDMRPVIVDGIPVVKRAAQLSVRLNHHLFDTLYHAVALEEGATLVTADEAYFSKAKGIGGIVSLANFAI
jgi:predicted nucleic acid-binding protein